MTILEKLAQIIDPEAFGLPAHDLGEFGMTDRDEARSKAHAVITALREPTDEMVVKAETVVPDLACFMEKEVSPAYLAWQAMMDIILNETCTGVPAPS